MESSDGEALPRANGRSRVAARINEANLASNNRLSEYAKFPRNTR